MLQIPKSHMDPSHDILQNIDNYYQGWTFLSKIEWSLFG